MELREFVKIEDTVYEIDSSALCPDDRLRHSRVCMFKVGLCLYFNAQNNSISILKYTKYHTQMIDVPFFLLFRHFLIFSNCGLDNHFLHDIVKSFLYIELRSGLVSRNIISDLGLSRMKLGIAFSTYPNFYCDDDCRTGKPCKSSKSF